MLWDFHNKQTKIQKVILYLKTGLKHWFDIKIQMQIHGNFYTFCSLWFIIDTQSEFSVYN